MKIILFIIILLASSGVAYAFVPQYGINNGLINYWSLDNRMTRWSSPTAADTVDSSGNEKNGVLTNMALSTARVTGKIQTALKFDGTNDYVLTTSTGGSNLTALTVSVWVNTSSVQTKMLIEDGTAFNTNSFYLYLNAGKPEFEVYDVSNDTFKTTANLPLNRWVHVVGVWSMGVRANIFIDGAPAAGASTGTLQSTNLITGNTFVMLGARPVGSPATSSTLNFNGSLDEVRIFDRALSNGEIRELYRQGL